MFPSGTEAKQMQYLFIFADREQLTEALQFEFQGILNSSACSCQFLFVTIKEEIFLNDLMGRNPLSQQVICFHHPQPPWPRTGGLLAWNYKRQKARQWTRDSPYDPQPAENNSNQPTLWSFTPPCVVLPSGNTRKALAHIFPSIPPSANPGAFSWDPTWQDVPPAFGNWENNNLFNGNHLLVC